MHIPTMFVIAKPAESNASDRKNTALMMFFHATFNCCMFLGRVKCQSACSPARTSFSRSFRGLRSGVRKLVFYSMALFDPTSVFGHV